MAARRAPHMRARDADRNDICRILDDALAEGQLSGEEHRQRVSAATSATTLGALQGLVTDLQTSSAPVPAQDAVPGTGRRLLVAAAAIGGVVAVGIGVYVAFSGGTDTPAPPPSTTTARPEIATPLLPEPVRPESDGVEPTVVAMPKEFHTVEGMTALLDTIRQRFGDTTGIELAIWRTDAMLLRPDPVNPQEKQLYRFSDGWGEPSNRDRDAEDHPADLGAFDVPAVVAALNNAPTTVGIAPADVSDLVIDIDPEGGPGGPLDLMVKVSSTAGTDGFVYLDSTGAIKRVEQAA